MLWDPTIVKKLKTILESFGIKCDYNDTQRSMFGYPDMLPDVLGFSTLTVLYEDRRIKISTYSVLQKRKAIFFAVQVDGIDLDGEDLREESFQRIVNVEFGVFETFLKVYKESRNEI